MSRWDDFDEFTAPPRGTLLNVAARHHCTLAEAAKIMQLPQPPPPLVKPVRFSSLDEGAGFQFKDVRWQKLGEHSARAIEQVNGVPHPLGQFEAFFLDDARVIPCVLDSV